MASGEKARPSAESLTLTDAIDSTVALRWRSEPISSSPAVEQKPSWFRVHGVADDPGAIIRLTIRIMKGMRVMEKL
jgi:hypothetical protein